MLINLCFALNNATQMTNMVIEPLFSLLSTSLSGRYLTVFLQSPTMILMVMTIVLHEPSCQSRQHILCETWYLSVSLHWGLLQVVFDDLKPANNGFVYILKSSANLPRAAVLISVWNGFHRRQRHSVHIQQRQSTVSFSDFTSKSCVEFSVFHITCTMY